MAFCSKNIFYKVYVFKLFCGSKCDPYWQMLYIKHCKYQLFQKICQLALHSSEFVYLVFSQLCFVEYLGFLPALDLEHSDFMAFFYDFLWILFSSNCSTGTSSTIINITAKGRHPHFDLHHRGKLVSPRSVMLAMDILGVTFIEAIPTHS